MITDKFLSKLIFFYSHLKEFYYQLPAHHDQKYSLTVTNREKLLTYQFWKNIAVQIIFLSLFQMQIHNMKLEIFIRIFIS